MAICKSCERTVSLWERYDGLCPECQIEKKSLDDQKKQVSFEENIEIDAEIDAILITTETAPNLNIKERLDIVTAQAAFEINNFKDILVGYESVKERSSELEKQLDILKKGLVWPQRKDPRQQGKCRCGDNIDISTVTIGQISMLMLVASGTAVVVGCL